MASARVVLADPSGRHVTLHPGHIIGRVSSAALLIDDPRVSEAHAMISLRRGQLLLLSLRRRVRVNGELLTEVPLRDGVEIELADGVRLEVIQCVTPGLVLAASHPAIGHRTLGSVASLMGRPARVIGRFVPDAPAHVWTVDGGWRLRIGDAIPRPVTGGEAFEVEGEPFVLDFVEDQGAASTVAAPRGAEVTIITYYDTVEVLTDGRRPALIGGRGARILSELASFGAPTPWELLAREVWQSDPAVSTVDLRRRWDTALSRLRQRLVTLGLRSDLIQADGAGAFRLTLTEGETVVDRS
ncbi:MAG: FHA domain-containing protein [Myxococcota bacterium]